MLYFRLKQKRYTEIYNAHFDYACQFIWRMARDKDMTEDIVQISFIKLFKSLKKFREDSTLKTYFTRILIHTFYDEMKRKKMNSIPINEIESELKSESVSEIEVDDYLHIASPMQRACLALYYQDGYSIKEIAHVFEFTEGTVKSHLSRGRQMIKHHILNQKGEL